MQYVTSNIVSKIQTKNEKNWLISAFSLLKKAQL